MRVRTLGNSTLQVENVYYPWTTPNGNGRLNQIKGGTPSVPNSLLNLVYNYDAVGNVMWIKDWKAGSPQQQTFTYDALDRLQTAQATGGTGGTYAQEPYQYNEIGNLTNKAGVAQWYNDAAHKHAITHLNGVQKFWYDANGNMTTRNDSTGNFTQSWDVENRLTSVSGSASATFVYDGDGNRVKATLGGVITAYVGNYYEQSGGPVKKYYYAGGTRIAMSDNGTVKYLLGDQLGSTSIVANSSGGFLTEQRYKPWGESRYTNGTAPTRYQFTGQRNDSEIGLYFYGARYYSSALGRFISADTIVPDSKNPQSLNRFSYTRNRPLNLIDPSGHRETDGCQTEGCSATQHDMDQAIGNAQYAESRKFYQGCAQGGGAECNTLHEVENIGKGIGLAFAGLGAGMIAGLAAPAVADGVATLGAKATVACAGSPVCAGLFGLGGAAGAEAANTTINNVNGGVNMGADTINIGGSVVGRDLIISGADMEQLNNIQQQVQQATQAIQALQQGQEMLQQSLQQFDARLSVMEQQLQQILDRLK